MQIELNSREMRAHVKHKALVLFATIFTIDQEIQVGPRVVYIYINDQWYQSYTQTYAKCIISCWLSS